MSPPSSARTKNGKKPRSNGLTYAQAGVNIHEGDRFVDLIMGHMRRTHGPRVISNDGGFAGLFRLDYNESLFKRNFEEPVLVACTDGAGTKVKLAADVGKYDTIGIDLVAMNVNDLVVQGAEPLLFLDYIACGKLVPERMERIVSGIADACKTCGCALLGGETAEMPDVYAADDFDLAGFAVGVAELSRVSDPTRVEPGDVIIGLESDGVHSNGYSLVRKIVKHARLDLVKVYPDLDKRRPLGEVLLTPTRLYAAPIVKLLRGYKVKKVITGMAHITGSGLADNLARALHDRVDAVVDESAWTPHPVFPFLQEHGNVDEAEMRQVFNMGIGFCVLTRPAFAKSIRDRLKRLGERPRIIGEVVRGKGEVRMKPRDE
ncbi:MAG TPA: phosphoribosylformylglycinamidine cyclo-ligase [Phycisphaerales bacterium]|nr:phosphoribosylformylglycinamidine cyclo-ligase [Phycisphaerales bacterium]